MSYLTIFLYLQSLYLCQIEVDEDKAELVGQTAQKAIQKAGEHFGFRCPLDGEYKIGNNWKETH